MQTVITESDADFIAQSAHILEETIQRCIAAKDRCVLGLSGGSTPRATYEQLGKSETIDWTKVFVFLADERYVHDLHEESNKSMVYETLLLHANIPEENMVFPDTSLQLDECLLQYEMELKKILQHGSPDILVLGMGEDGHIASLFPPVADEAFGNHLVIHTQTDTFAIRDRISITMQVLRQADACVFLLKGNKKKHVWEKMLASSEDEKRWPAKAVLKENTVVVGQW